MGSTTNDISETEGAYRVTARTGKKQSLLTKTADEVLTRSLQEAMQRANLFKREILVSFIQPTAAFDPINTFHHLKKRALGDCLFWEQSAQQRAIVGCSPAATIETLGEERFMSTHAAWSNLLEHAVIATLEEGGNAPCDYLPLALGGFSFDVHTPQTSLWQDFPHGLFILPRILLHQAAGRATVTVNIFVQPDDSLTACQQEIVFLQRELRAALASAPFQPERISSTQKMAVRSLHSSSTWKALVTQATRQIQQGTYEKVVLARAVEALLPGHLAFDISSILQRLTRSYPTASVFAIQRGKRFFVGATPEQLVSVHNKQFQAMALAGSAPRGATPEEDLVIGRQLLQSGKNKDEHEIVVAMMRQTLKHLCQRVSLSAEPRLLQLKNVQHLLTPITGELLPNRHILEIVAHLHPTPAVGGLPRHAALEAIREEEQLDRGWYAGPLGWLDAQGNGEFIVAIRSGLIHQNRATLFAGCGIVAYSDPHSEYLESCLKLQAMQHALSGEE
jgi:isochorismate synthase